MLDVKLKTFLTLIEEKSTIRCAEVLHITQPAVTQHIRALEKEYDVELFIKEGRCLVPSEKGKELYRMAKQLATMDKQMHMMMRKKKTIPLYFGATRSIAETILPSLSASLLKEYPDRKCKLVVQNTHTLLEELKEGNLYFALIEGNVDHRQYVCEPLFETNFICVCKKDGRYADCKTIQDILQAPLFLREKGSGSRDIVEHTLQSFDIDVKDFAVCHEVESISVILSLVKEDLGITFIYKDAAKDYIEKGILQQLLPEIVSIQRNFTFVMLPDMPFSEENKKVFEFFKETIHTSGINM